MKILPASALALLLAAAAFGTAPAQTAPAATNADASATPPPHKKFSPEERVNHRVKYLTEKLTLTDAQQAQVKTILTDEDAKAHAVFSNDALAEDAKKAQLKAAREDARTKIRAVLTADQQKTFDTLKEEHHHGKPPGAPAAQ